MAPPTSSPSASTLAKDSQGESSLLMRRRGSKSFAARLALLPWSKRRELGLVEGATPVSNGPEMDYVPAATITGTGTSGEAEVPSRSLHQNDVTLYQLTRRVSPLHEDLEKRIYSENAAQIGRYIAKCIYVLAHSDLTIPGPGGATTDLATATAAGSSGGGGGGSDDDGIPVLGWIQAALQYADRALRTAEESEFPLFTCRPIAYRAHCLRRLGQENDSRAAFKEAADIARATAVAFREWDLLLLKHEFNVWARVDRRRAQKAGGAEISLLSARDRKIIRLCRQYEEDMEDGGNGAVGGRQNVMHDSGANSAAQGRVEYGVAVSTDSSGGGREVQSSSTWRPGSIWDSDSDTVESDSEDDMYLAPGLELEVQPERSGFRLLSRSALRAPPSSPKLVEVVASGASDAMSCQGEIVDE